MLFIGVGALATSNTGDNLASSSAFLVAVTVVQLASLVAVFVTGSWAHRLPARRRGRPPE